MFTFHITKTQNLERRTPVYNTRSTRHPNHCRALEMLVMTLYSELNSYCFILNLIYFTFCHVD